MAHTDLLDPETARHTLRVVGIVLHQDGTLRLFQRDENLLAEVNGFRTDRGRRFLQLLGGQLEDLLAEVLVTDRPDLYRMHPSELGSPSMHWRRDS